MIAGFQAGHPFTDLHNNTAAFVSQDRREYAFRIITRKGKGIGMANAGVGDAYQELRLSSAARHQSQQF